MSTQQGADDSHALDTLNKTGKKDSILGKVNARIQDAIQSGRGGDEVRGLSAEATVLPSANPDQLAMKRSKSVRGEQMIVPEGVVIEGAMSSATDTEISGRIDGDVTVDARLTLKQNAQIYGKVRAVSCRVDGLVEGKLDCSAELALGSTGRLNADAMAGKGMVVAGQVNGNVTCGGLLRVESTARISGNVRARALAIEEGAVMDGQCSIGAKKQKNNAS